MPISDPFKDYAPSLDAPIFRIAEVTPDDGSDLVLATRAINVATTGTVRVTTVQGDTAIIHVAAGIPFAIRVARIWATGTTATGIVAMS